MAGTCRPGRICVLRPGALGDAILALPVLESLGEACPGADITVVGPAVFDLAVDCGLARRRVPFDDTGLLGLFTEGGTSQVVAGCDTCLVFGKELNATLAASLKRSGVARLVEWPAWPVPGLHIVDHLLGAVEEAGYRIATRVPRLRLPTLARGQGAGEEPTKCRMPSAECRMNAECPMPSSTEREPEAPPDSSFVIRHPSLAALPPAWLAAADAFVRDHGVPARFAAIHPGSGGRWKRWPVALFIELARRLTLPVVWLLGPAEAEDAAFLALGGLGAAMAADLPLRTLAGLLTRCAVYIGNDAGVSHLAAAVGAPTVAIFGPTDPAVWGPRGAHVRIVGGPDAGELDAVTVEQVLSAAAEQSAVGSRQ